MFIASKCNSCVVNMDQVLFLDVKKAYREDTGSCYALIAHLRDAEGIWLDYSDDLEQLMESKRVVEDRLRFQAVHIFVDGGSMTAY